MNSRYGWVMVALGALMSCVAVGAMFSLAVFLQPMTADTGWSRAGISAAMTLNFLAMGVAGFGWGALSDRYGPRPVALASAVLLGLGLEEDEQEMRLRYFDQSHLIREMRHYFDMTPGQLHNRPHPLLAITAEIRQARRLEALARIGAGENFPWRDPAAEPEE